VWLAILALIVVVTPSLALAQEGEMQVVDEVIAQVNDDVITLSMLKREMKEAVDARKENHMSDQQANDEVAKHRDDLIATLINEQLLVQKGKELELSDKVEAEVNRRMLGVMKEQGFKTMLELEKAMRESGVDPVGVRQSMRAEIMKQAVFEQEVDAKIFYGFTMDELHKYFDAHKDKFRKPEVVTISEIFLSLAGRNEADVKAKAGQLVTQIRGGADFKTVCVANSEREVSGERIAAKTQCKIGTFETPNLREDITGALKTVKVGDVTYPLKGEDGYQIFRIDERTAASDASVFNENQVREAIAIERSPKAREEYLQHLRDEAYIKIGESYRAGVSPLLKVKPEAVVEKSSDDSFAPAKGEKKGRGKFLKIFPKP
jgi:peptidyl-prolyl cis-trans isomerase SurA